MQKPNGKRTSFKRKFRVKIVKQQTKNMYNWIAYTIYLITCFLITVFVGHDLHKKGMVLINNLFENENFTKTVSNILLTSYYLVNLGYVAISISSFNTVVNRADLFETLTLKIGIILLLLGALHFNNIIILTALSKHKAKILKLFNN